MDNNYGYNKIRAESILPASKNLQEYLESILHNFTRIDRISVRAKSESSFNNKSQKKLDDGSLKYTDPYTQIQDIIGARIITYYLSDVELVANFLMDYFRAIEQKDIIPDSASKFGYEGKHFIFYLPEEAKKSINAEKIPVFFEMQIKTLFQHAWGEAEHDLAYKTAQELNNDHHRRVAFTAAQAWGADRIFNELHLELRQD